MKVKKTEYGDLEYKSPNIYQMLQLVGQIGLNENKSMNYIQGKLIEVKGDYVDFSNLRDSEGKGFKSYDELCEDFTMMIPLCEIAGEILDSFIQGSKKKEELEQVFSAFFSKIPLDKYKELKPELSGLISKHENTLLKCSHIQSAIDMGLTVNWNDLTYEEFIDFKAFKDKLSLWQTK